MRLSDLSISTEFEYFNSVRSFTAKAVCSHWGELEVNVISELEKTMENKMGHFIGWKFGVPVRIFNIRGVEICSLEYLIDESEKYFRVLGVSGEPELHSKANRTYELIPHKYSSQFIGNFKYSPRYPVCQAPGYTAFCNGDDTINILDAGKVKLQSMLTATITIDGKTIELSAETTANFKEQLGI